MLFYTGISSVDYKSLEKKFNVDDAEVLLKIQLSLSRRVAQAR